MASQMGFSYFESMVSKPTSKDILLDLISSQSIDPWNIDIVSLSDGFIKKVREMEKMDFIVQANVILAASILLKYKSNYLKVLSYQSELPVAYEETTVSDPEEMPQLTLSSRIPPKSQITIEELMGEMERIIKYDEVERVHIPRGSIVETIDMEVAEHDIEYDMDQILKQIKENTDQEGWCLFSRIVAGVPMNIKVYSLLCLLHLVQDGSIDLRQDELFGEIFIHIQKISEKVEEKMGTSS